MFLLILRRIIRTILVVLILSFVIFFIIRVIPGDPASLIAPMATEEAKEEIREELGLKGPVITQYVIFISDVLRGDFGESIYYKKSVVLLIFSVLPYTFILILGALFLSLSVSFPLGVISSIKPGSIIDRISFFISVLMISVPYFWLGMVMILVLSIRYKLLPGFGYDGWQYFILPIITLAVTLIPVQLRTIRISMEDILEENFILFAKARGIPNKILIWKYAFKNTIIPLTSLLGVQAGALLGTTIMVEWIFSFPGLGLMTLYAMQRRDYQLIQGLVVVFALICTFLCAGVDILQLLMDPRLRKQMRL